MWQQGVVCLVLGAASAAATAACAAGAPSAYDHRLAGLRYGKRLATHLGCLESAARYLKVGVTPAWPYGATGHAFVMSLSEDLGRSVFRCLSAPDQLAGVRRQGDRLPRGLLRPAAGTCPGASDMASHKMNNPTRNRIVAALERARHAESGGVAVLQ